MNINRNNYEEFFLDYYDGNLNPHQVSELFRFINSNPDIKEEFDSFESFSIVADEQIVFDNKEQLKKKDVFTVGSIDESNYEMFFVAKIENDLSEKESANVQLFIERNPHLAETYHLLKLTKLKPDTSIVFENKETIKKKEIIPVGVINPSNYETFFVADCENDLCPKEKHDLDQFLLQNAQLVAEFDLFKQTKLVPDTTIEFENKESLKKKEIITVGLINAANYENFFIADLENDLTSLELENLKEFLSKNGQLLPVFELFKHTKITTDTSIVFDNKSSLKKFVISPVVKKKSYAYQYLAIAASVLIIFGIYQLFENTEKSNLTAYSNILRNNMGWSENSSLTRDFTNLTLNNNEIETQKTPTSSSRNVKYPLKTLKPTKINAIPLNPENENNITAFRNSGKFIGSENNLLADNSDMPKNKSSEPITVKEFIISKFRKDISQSSDEINQPSDRLTLWDVAQAGIAGINKFTKNDIKLKKDASKPDNSYALIGKNFSISRNYSGN